MTDGPMDARRLPRRTRLLLGFGMALCIGAWLGTTGSARTLLEPIWVAFATWFTARGLPIPWLVAGTAILTLALLALAAWLVLRRLTGEHPSRGRAAFGRTRPRGVSPRFPRS